MSHDDLDPPKEAHLYPHQQDLLAAMKSIADGKTKRLMVLHPRMRGRKSVFGSLADLALPDLGPLDLTSTCQRCGGKYFRTTQGLRFCPDCSADILALSGHLPPPEFPKSWFIIDDPAMDTVPPESISGDLPACLIATAEVKAQPTGKKCSTCPCDSCRIQAGQIKDPFACPSTT